MRVAVVLAVVVLVADQLAKLWILEIAQLDQIGRIEILPPFLEFRMAWNRGINFGLFSGNSELVRWVLVAIAFCLATFFLVWSGRPAHNRLARVSAGILAGGAVGNGIDRIRLGAVADFLNISCCGIENPFVFNVADIAVVAGVIGMVLAGYRRSDRESR